MAVPTLLRGNCIVKGARIATPTGDVLIENLKPHDTVLTQNFSGQIETGVVVALRESTTDSYLNLRLADGTSLNATPEHPLATTSGWRKAGTLKPGDTVLTERGSETIAAVTPHREHVQVYDLTVHPNPNFFANGILVHNKSGGNALAAAATGRAIAEAQFIYHRSDYNKDGVIEYAQNIRDLLETKPDAQDLLLVDPAMGPASDGPSKGKPKAGYFFKMLTAQGSHAKGGAMSYIENGHMTRGFAVLAYPAAGTDFTQVFILNHDGIIFQKNFTPEALLQVHTITEFNPDPSWIQTE